MVSSERWRRIRELFAMIADCGPEERANVLSGLRGDDAGLCAEVEGLLRQHDRPGGILTDRANGDWLFDTEPDRSLLSPGEVVSGRFKVRRLVGCGGMGEVYECDDQELQQRVALKALRPIERHGAPNVSSFKREIQLALRVTHPNVCRVFDIGRHDAGPRPVDFFTMELVEGETLADHLRRNGPLSPEQARPLILQIASGLGALHDCEIVHRDLKPSNVLLQRDESGVTRVVLTDFGIARFIGDGAATGAATAQIMGTPDYMAPEQLTGKAAGPATDLFSFGILLYEMLTGAKPFPDDNHRTAQPVQPRVHNPDIPRRWNLLILSCLQTDIGARPQSVDAVFQALDTARTKAGDTRPVAAPKPVRRNFVLAAAFLLAVVALWGAASRYMQQGATSGVDRRVAVLPLGIVGNNPELQAMADGLTETISSRLSQYEGLNEQLVVVPSSEIRRLSVGAASDARGVLGANYVVEGRLAAQDGRARLTLTLIDAERMVQQESAVVDGELVKILDLEDSAVRRIATLLDLQAQPDQFDSVAVTAPGADEFYLQGKGYLQRSDDIDSLNNAVALFKKTIALSPNHARAYADLGRAYLNLYNRTQSTEPLHQAEQATEKSLSIHGSSVEGLIARGEVLTALARYDDAFSIFERALEMAPRSADVHAGLARVYEAEAEAQQEPRLRQSLLAKAEAAYLKSLSLRPGDWVAYKHLGMFYYRSGDYEKAIQQLEYSAALAPDNAQAFVNIGSFAYFAGRFEEAERSWKHALELDPQRVSTRTNLALLHHDRGEYREAVALYQEILKQERKSHRVWGNYGSALQHLGQTDAAAAAYKQAIAILEGQLEQEPASLDIRSYLAHHYAEIKDAERALRHASTAVESRQPDVVMRAALAYDKLGLAKQAKSAVQRAQFLGYASRSSESTRLIQLYSKH